MEQRNLERFRKPVILVHWLAAISFAVLLVTGALMFFRLTDINGGKQIRIVHEVAAAFFVITAALFTISDPKAALSFLKTAFRWDSDDRAWIRGSASFYSGGKATMPSQSFINADQKLWQAVVIVTSAVFMLTGSLLWFFKFKIPLALYQWVSLAHAAAFVVVSLMFLLHLYLTTLHPAFEESLSSMVDGKVSASYARKRYGKWYDEKTGKE